MQSSDYKVMPPPIIKGKIVSVYKVRHDNGTIFTLKKIKRTIPGTNTPMEQKYIGAGIYIMNTLTHPNVIRLRHFWLSGSNYNIIYDFFDRGSLDQEILNWNNAQNLTFPQREMKCVFYLMQILNGFMALHTLRVMHRDFKPSNVHLKNDGSLVIAEFGICQLGLELAGTAGKGSFAYMAPEVLPGKEAPSYSNKVDLWSIGVTFYEMVFGEPLYTITEEDPAKAEKEWREQVGTRNGETLWAPQGGIISPECEDLIKRLLDLDSGQRISWSEVFNHGLFSLYSNHQLEVATGFSRNKIDEVRTMFVANREANPGPQMVRFGLTFIDEEMDAINLAMGGGELSIFF